MGKGKWEMGNAVVPGEPRKIAGKLELGNGGAGAGGTGGSVQQAPTFRQRVRTL